MLGGLKVMDGDFTVGMLVAYQTLLGSFTRPLASFVNFGSTLQELPGRHEPPGRRAALPRRRAVSDGEPRRQTAGAAVGAAASRSRADHPPPARVKLSGRVELRGITFGYSPLDKPLIDNFNLIVEPGRRVALVGGSGSGKSTVAKLISGLYEPWGGEILFDGVPRQSLPRDLIVNSLAVVDQEVFLFGGSVTENVTMWDPTISGPRVVHGGRDAAIDDVIAAREGGYQSRGPGRRRQLQRRPVPAPRDRARPGRRADHRRDGRGDQRARPDHRDADRREHAPARLHHDHHRAPAQHHPRRDEIIVMERGQIVQRGTHDEMKDIDGPYKHLVGHQ